MTFCSVLLNLLAVTLEGMRQIVVIAHDIRSCHNVGSLLRTADGLGVDAVYLTGYTPYPPLTTGDPRLPHLAAKIGRQISKTALGAERSVNWHVRSDLPALLQELRKESYRLVALEQAANSISLPDYTVPDKVALLIGREVEGVDHKLLKAMDDIIEIPMLGQKESFNVVQAVAMALYQLRIAP